MLSTTPQWLRVLARLASLAGTLGVALPAAAQDGEPPRATLTLRGGVELVGEPLPGPEGALLWQDPAFARPLALAPDEIQSIVWYEQEPGPLVVQPFLVTLRGGDRCLGRLIAINTTHVTVETRAFGELRVPREHVEQLRNLAAANIVHDGPPNPSEWLWRSAADSWRREGAGVVLQLPGLFAGRDLGLDQPTEVELRLAWSERPEFRIWIGGVPNAPAPGAIVVQPWGETLVAYREGATTIEAIELVPRLNLDSSLTLRLTVLAERVEFASEERRMGSLARGPLANGAGPGKALAIENLGLGTHVLEINATRVNRKSTAKLVLAGGDVQSYSAADGRLLAASGALGLDQVQSIVFSEPAPAPQPAIVRTSDGQRMSGRLVGCSQDGLRWIPGWSDEPLACALEGLAQVRFNREPEELVPDKERWLLNHGQRQVFGELVGFDPELGGYVLRPAGTAATAPLAEGASVLIAPASNSSLQQSRTGHLLYFRGGEVLPCHVVAVDAAGVRVESRYIDEAQRSYPWSVLKAVEFDSRSTEKLLGALQRGARTQRQVARNAAVEVLTAARLETILQLPRKFKASPPTHLILARNGDALKVELESLVGNALVVRAAGQTAVSIPLSRIASLVDISLEQAPIEGLLPAAAPRPTPPLHRLSLGGAVQVWAAPVATNGAYIEFESPSLGRLSVNPAEMWEIQLKPNAVRPANPFTDFVLVPMKEPFPDSGD